MFRSRGALGLAMLVGLVAGCRGSVEAGRGQDSPDASGTSTRDGSTHSHQSDAGDGGARANGDGAPPADGSVNQGDGAVTGCAAVVCEDFEGTGEGAIPAGWQKSAYGDATIQTSDDLAHSGSKSLRVQLNGPTSEQYIQNTELFPAPNNTFYGRLWFRIDGGALANAIHWNMVEARGDSPSVLVRYGGGNPLAAPFTHFFLYNLWTSAGETGKEDDHAPGIALGQWHCMEWMFAGKPGSQEASFGGTASSARRHIAGRTGATDGFEMPTFNAVKVGFAVYGPGFTTPFDVHIDDVALGHARLGCN